MILPTAPKEMLNIPAVNANATSGLGHQQT